MRKLLLQSHFLGLGFALLLLLAVSVGTYELGAQYYAYAERTKAVNGTLANLKDLLDDVRIAEASELAGALTGEQSDKAAIAAAIGGVGRRMAYLAPILQKRNPEQFRSLQASVGRFGALLAQFPDAQRGRPVIEEFRPKVASLQLAVARLGEDERAVEQEEQSAAVLSRAAARGYARAAQLTAAVGCAAIFAIVLFSTVRIQRLVAQLGGLNLSLSQAADEFRQLADGMPQFVWKAKENGALEYVNRRWSQFCGSRSWQSLLHPEERQAFEVSWRDARLQGSPLTTECRLASDSKQPYSWYLFRAMPFEDKRTREQKWYCTFTDIGNQKLVESALQRANEDLLQFAHAAAHDLQEPLRNISTSLGLLERRNPDMRSDPRMSPIRESIQHAQRMFRMVQDLLAFAKADSVTARTLVDSRAVLERAEDNLRELIAETGGVDLKVAPLPRIVMDEVQLLQIFQNLLSNSLKYRKPHERLQVKVSAARVDQEWVFAVQDNGIGFDQRYAKMIFGVFKRLHNQSDYSGNGMGLAICSRIIASNRGRIWAEGEVGVGARFYFAVPVLPEDTQPLAALGHDHAGALHLSNG